MDIFRFAQKIVKRPLLIVKNANFDLDKKYGIGFSCTFEDRGEIRNHWIQNQKTGKWDSLGCGHGKSLDAAVRDYIELIRGKKIGFLTRYGEMQEYDVPPDLKTGSYY